MNEILGAVHVIYVLGLGAAFGFLSTSLVKQVIRLRRPAGRSDD